VPTFDELGSGGVVVSGNTAPIQDFDYIGSGGVLISDSAIANFTNNFNIGVFWNVNALKVQDFTFLWDTGELRILWYRLIGKGRDPACPIIHDDICCQKYIMNVHARTISELCEKLKSRRWKWPIQSVEVFSRPARNVDIAEDESGGINHECNILTPVEVCNVPECFDFCVDQDHRINIGFKMRVARQEFFAYEASGQIQIMGSATTSFIAEGVYDEEGNGGLIAGGVSEDTTDNAGPGHFIYMPSGQVNVSGDPEIISSALSFTSDGSEILISGSADAKSNFFGNIPANIGFDMGIRNLSVFFSQDVDSQNLVEAASFVSRCGCDNIPTEINFGHNIAQNNVLSQFLIRNRFTITSPIKLRYNNINNMWQANLNYKGFSPDANSQERWDFVFEVQCTDTIGGITLGQNVWKVGIHVLRKNLTTLQDFDTRILVGLLPDASCVSGDLIFTIVYDTQIDFVAISPNATIYLNSIWDNIGLFRNSHWINSPNLILEITELGAGSLQQRVNLNQILVPSDAR
jgi:hypothetical protein